MLFLLVTVSLGDDYQRWLLGLGKTVDGDYDRVEDCLPGAFLQGAPITKGPSLWVPMDSRTTASPTGAQDYVRYGGGGLSWTVPWLAGLYALACQVQPEVTPQAFIATAYNTGRKVAATDNGQPCTLNRVVDPQALLAALQGP